jgi:hypothetical protein
LNNTVEEIQRMLDEHSKDSDLISSWVASRFSDLALMSEVRRQLGLFQPWCTAWRSKCFVEDDVPYFFSMVECVHDFTSCAALNESDPVLFAYPSDKRRTRETVNQMRLSEKRLDKFWDRLDEHCEVHTSYPVLYLLNVRMNGGCCCKSITANSSSRTSLEIGIERFTEPNLGSSLVTVIANRVRKLKMRRMRKCE